MKVAPLPSNEQGRIAALNSYRILDTPYEPVFDAITHLAATVCNVPIAIISLIDRDRR